MRAGCSHARRALTERADLDSTEHAAKRSRLSPEAEVVASDDSSSGDEALLADSVWASLGADVGPTTETAASEAIAAAAATESSDEEDYSQLLDLGISDEPVSTAPDSDALLAEIVAVDPPAPAPSLPPDVAALLDTSIAPTQTLSAPDDPASSALFKLQAMLASAVEEAAVEGTLTAKAEADDDMVMSEDEVIGSGDEAGLLGGKMELDEEVHSDDNDIPAPPEITCAVCLALYTSYDSLVRHLNTHVPNRAYLCDGCGKSFSRQDALKRHTLGPSATIECQESRMELNPNAAAEAADCHARYLQLSLDGERAPEAKTAVPPPPKGKKTAPATSGPTTRKLRVKTEVVERAGPPPTRAKTAAAAPAAAAESKALEPLDERSKPGLAAIQAAHLQQVFARLPPDVDTIEEVLRLANITGEQVALLHFVFSEVRRHQAEFRTSMVWGMPGPS